MSTGCSKCIKLEVLSVRFGDVLSVRIAPGINLVFLPKLCSKCMSVTIYVYIYTWTSKSCIFFGLDWKVVSDQKSNNCWFCPLSVTFGRSKTMTQNDAKDQLFDTKTVSLNPSFLAQKWILGPHPNIHKDRKLCGSRTVQVYYIYIYTYIYIIIHIHIKIV